MHHRVQCTVIVFYVAAVELLLLIFYMQNVCLVMYVELLVFLQKKYCVEKCTIPNFSELYWTVEFLSYKNSVAKFLLHDFFYTGTTMVQVAGHFLLWNNSSDYVDNFPLLIIHKKVRAKFQPHCTVHKKIAETFFPFTQKAAARNNSSAVVVVLTRQ